MIPLRDDNPTATYPVVTHVLIAVNAVIWFLSLPNRMAWNIEFGLIPWELVQGQVLEGSMQIGGIASLFTSMFMHGGFMHAAGNMLYLWIFGDNIEDRLGHLRFLLFYLVCGLAAAGSQVASLWFRVAPPAEPIPLDLVLQGMVQSPAVGWFIPMVGASGAIAGVLAAYMLLYPRARVHTLIPIGFFITTARVPALFLIGIWFLIQVFSSSFATAGTGGVAWWAHIGGFVAGAVILKIFRIEPNDSGQKPFQTGTQTRRGKFGEPKW